jgi:hypothetical protein
MQKAIEEMKKATQGKAEVRAQEDATGIQQQFTKKPTAHHYGRT